MSNRYVWNRYGIELQTNGTVTAGAPSSIIVNNVDTSGSASSSVPVDYSTSIQRNGANIELVNPTERLFNFPGSNGYTFPVGTYIKVNPKWDYRYNIVIEDVLYVTSEMELRPSGSTLRAYSGSAIRYSGYTKGSANGTASNSGASTYPPNDTRPRIASICVIPALLRRCNHVE